MRERCWERIRGDGGPRRVRRATDRAILVQIDRPDGVRILATVKASCDDGKRGGTGRSRHRPGTKPGPRGRQGDGYSPAHLAGIEGDAADNVYRDFVACSARGYYLVS